MVGTSFRIHTGFGKETMQRKENITSRYGRKEKQKNISSRTKVRNVITCILLSLVMGVCGCTKKEQLVLSAQNDTAVNMEENRTGETLQSDNDDTVDKPKVTEQSTADVDDTRADLAEEDGSRQSIYVHVCGAVVNPGVYELPTGSRVYEAVQAAGGFTEEADENYVNQAFALTDAVQLVIPTVEEAEAWKTQNGQAEGQTAIRGGAAETPGSQEVSASDGKININTASESQLCDIPGIGAVRAAAIAAYRQEHGAFETIEDIMKVSGIKQGTYDKIKDSIIVN